MFTSLTMKIAIVPKIHTLKLHWLSTLRSLVVASQIDVTALKAKRGNGFDSRQDQLGELGTEGCRKVRFFISR